jgi:hypothetical protein
LGVNMGGMTARLVAEARVVLRARVAAFFSGAVGGAWMRETRTPLAGARLSAWDGGPSLGTSAGILTPMGSGVWQVALGFAWTPLGGLSLANADGAALTVGYRLAWW